MKKLKSKDFTALEISVFKLRSRVIVCCKDGRVQGSKPGRDNIFYSNCTD
jgi:hypothetical protein